MLLLKSSMYMGARARSARGLGIVRDSPLLTLGQQVVEDADKVQACAGDAGREEDGCQAVCVHVPGTGQDVIPAAHLCTRMCHMRVGPCPEYHGTSLVAHVADACRKKISGWTM